MTMVSSGASGGPVSNGTGAAVSGRDLLVDEWFTRELHQVREPDGACGLLVLLGGRGSGKSTLLDRLELRARHTYLARLDCEQLDARVQGPADVLARIAFQLTAELATMPQLRLPAYAATRLALAVQTAPADRAASLDAMNTALAEGRGQERSVDLFVNLAEKSGAVAGVPALALAALPFLGELLKSWQLLRVRRTLRRQLGTNVPATDFLVGVGHNFQFGDEQQRRKAEGVLTRAFLDDLRRAYTSDAHHEQRGLRCLVLLDNADDQRGLDFLAALTEARRKGTAADPLLVLATARSRPEPFEEMAPVGGGLTRCWHRTPEPAQESFVPLPARTGARAGIAQLRMLSRTETQAMCEPAVRELPPVPDVRRTADWLGRVLHETTGGHPLATAATLRELANFPEEVPVVTRLRRIFAPHGARSVAEEGYRQYFGDVSPGVQDRLRRLAAAAVPHQALAAADGLLGPGIFLVDQVMDLLGDELRTDTARIDDASVLVLPVLARRRLLYRLADDDGAWATAHRVLRDSMLAHDAAHHDLALDDIPAATRYLHGLFERVREGEARMDDWCRALSWIQRAPHPRLREPRDGVQEYEDTVARIAGDVPEERMPMARLLIAGRLTLHPVEDPYDGLWSDPLWDPTAQLRNVIAGQLVELCERLPYPKRVLLSDRVQSYEKEPW
jgi:hypothetical protein